MRAGCASASSPTPRGIDNLLAVAGTGPTPWLYDGRLRMVGVKLYFDGALGSRGAWLKAPYRDAPGQRGLPLTDDTALRNLMSRAAMDNFQVAVHAIGDEANAQLLASIEELSLTYSGDRRWRIEHAQIVDPADLPRFGRNSIIASMQPTHQTSDRLMAEARMGIERLQGAYAWRSMLDNRVPLAFGSDFPVESPNPFPGLAAAVTREDAQGQPPGGWLPQQRLSMEQAFAAFTRGGAFAGFAEDRLGTLEPGRMADFIFIDRDIFADPRPAGDPRDAGAGDLCRRAEGVAAAVDESLAAPVSCPDRQELRQHLRLRGPARNRDRAARPSGPGARGSGRSRRRPASSRRPAP